MPTFIALYRGINVGGKNSVKMESLRAMHERLGHKNVLSYIQSGNVIFSATGSANTHAKKIAAEFADEFGFAPRVLVVAAKDWAALIEANPYAKHAAKNPKSVHACICAGEPSESGLKALLTKTASTETFTTGKAIIYLHTPDGFGTSKFAAGMEKACGVPITARNWRTIEEIWKLANRAK
jgi:uncharacterized protein (DUF1697 family)